MSLPSNPSSLCPWNPLSTVADMYNETDESNAIPLKEINDENVLDKRKCSTRVLLVGDAHIGKYELYDNLKLLSEEENVSSTQDWITIRTNSCLLFNQIEDKFLRDAFSKKKECKYENIDFFLMFFSLTKLESLYSVAYKWAPEVEEIMEKNEARYFLGLIGIIDDKTNPVIIPEFLITSLKSMIAPDFYFEMNKSCSFEEMSDLFSLIDKKIAILNKSKKKGIEDDISTCLPEPTLQNEPSIENYLIFNHTLIEKAIMDQKKWLKKLQNNVKDFRKIEIIVKSLKKGLCNSLIANIKRVLKYELDNEQNRKKIIFDSKRLKRHSEEIRFLKEQISDWNASLWSKKEFKQFIRVKSSLDNKDKAREMMKKGFQHLMAANDCYQSSNISNTDIIEFERVMLQCIITLSDDTKLSFLQLTEFYLLCQFNLIKCLEYLIYIYPKAFGYLMMCYSKMDCQSPHPINLLEDGSFVHKVVEIYNPHLYFTHRDYNGHNFLYFFAIRNFERAFMSYIIRISCLKYMRHYFDPEKIKKIGFLTGNKDFADIMNFKTDNKDSLNHFKCEEKASSLIATAAQSGNEMIANFMFKSLEEEFENNEFITYFDQSNYNSTPLLVICAIKKLHELLMNFIYFFIKRKLENELVSIIIKRNKSVGGRTLLQCIQCEDLLSQLIPLCLKNDPQNLLIKCDEGKHLGHYMAERNFSVVLQTIHLYCTTHDLKDFYFFKFILAPNKYGDDCLKLAAWNGSNDFLVIVLSACRGLNQSYLNLLLHGENEKQENLMEKLILQQRSLIVPRQMIIHMEKEVHTGDKAKILSCYREQISPSQELFSLIKDTEKLLPLSTSQKYMIIVKKFISLMLSLALFLSDVCFDISLAVEYNNGNDTACNMNFYDYDGENETNFDRAQRYIGTLCFSTRFYITLVFILSPWLFYAFEFLTETFINHRPMYFVRVSYRDIKIPFCHLVIFVVEFILTIVFWPIISMFQSFHAEVMYEIEHGLDKIKAHEYKNTATKICLRARLIEALLESSFQPILQLYLVLPILVNYMNSDKPRELVYDVYLEVVQFVSAVISIASLSWAITAYQAGSKGGAMDFTANFLGRVVLLLSNLFAIAGRLLLFVVFAYGFGPGRLVGLLTFIIIHILFTTFLTFCLRNPDDDLPSKVSYVINCFINGFGNCYLHMWILLPQNVISSAKSGKPTCVRQFIFEALFFTELCAMVICAWMMLDTQVAEAIQLNYLILSIFGFYFLGIGFRVIYYKFVHIWSGLISTQIEESMSRMFNHLTPASISRAPNPIEYVYIN